MQTTRTFRHQDYELVCTAKPLDGNRYAPALTVAKQVWPTRPREIAVERGEPLTEQAAIDAAYPPRLERIANYG